MTKTWKVKVGKRGQVTIPNTIRAQFGLGPNSEVKFSVVRGRIVLKKVPKKLDLDKWIGYCAGSFAKLGYSSVDDYIEDIRGR